MRIGVREKNKIKQNKKQTKIKQINKQKEQTLKRTIFAILTGLLHRHLPYTINHHEHLSYFMQVDNTMTAHVLAFS